MSKLCPNCNAPMEFMPDAHELHCERCGYRRSTEADERIEALECAVCSIQANNLEITAMLRELLKIYGITWDP